MGFEAWGALQDSVALAFPLKTSDCGDILWLVLELHLGGGRPPSVAVGLSAFYSLLLSLFCSAFSPFFPCRLSFAVGEADSFAPGKALDQAGRNVASSHRKSVLWGMALASQSQLSSCVSGHRRSELSQGASFNPEMTGGGSVWGGREQACCGRLDVPGETEEAVETRPGSWGRPGVFSLPPGDRGLGKDKQRLASGLRPSQPAGGWGVKWEPGSPGFKS